MEGGNSKREILTTPDDLSTLPICALDARNVEVCNIMVGGDYFIGMRDQRRTVSFSHPEGECCVCSDERGLKMKCDHCICPDDLLDHVWQQIKSLKYKMSCATCTHLIDFSDILKFGLPNEDEKQFLTTAISVNFCAQQDIQQCPGCKSYCERKVRDEILTTCLMCTRNNGRSFNFCWFCLKDWNNPGDTKFCGNEGCNKEKLELIENSPMMVLKDQDRKEVKVPKLRACLKCGSIIEHRDGCNEMTCKCCRHVFCFICLRPQQDGSLICKSTTWNLNAPITCVPAPIQKKIVKH